eukprot:767574-Hanusia_phi.AAC.7
MEAALAEVEKLSRRLRPAERLRASDRVLAMILFARQEARYSNQRSVGERRGEGRDGRAEEGEGRGVGGREGRGGEEREGRRGKERKERRGKKREERRGEKREGRGWEEREESNGAAARRRPPALTHRRADGEKLFSSLWCFCCELVAS